MSPSRFLAPSPDVSSVVGVLLDTDNGYNPHLLQPSLVWQTNLEIYFINSKMHTFSHFNISEIGMHLIVDGASFYLQQFFPSGTEN